MEVNMQTKLGHLQFGIDGQNRGFYRDLFTFLGWQILHEGEGVIGVGDSNHVSLWFGDATKTVANDYDGPGLNHFDTPRHRPEFAGGDNTYYQVMFETPDRILAEVVYIGPKQ
jgi:hypothetical protein